MIDLSAYAINMICQKLLPNIQVQLCFIPTLCSTAHGCLNIIKLSSNADYPFQGTKSKCQQSFQSEGTAYVWAKCCIFLPKYKEPNGGQSLLHLFKDVTWNKTIRGSRFDKGLTNMTKAPAGPHHLSDSIRFTIR